MIHLTVDARGLPIAVEVTGGQINDLCAQACALIAKVAAAEIIIADKSYDSEVIGNTLNSKVPKL